MLNPIEIATTASSDGDVYGALSTFPGVQKQGETGEIIVRGGEASETRTYIDGMLVSSPYSSTTPDLPARGRFTPFMFNGVMFSTGGYSAEYGQALSSVLELQTPGNFDEQITSISLMNVGFGASHTHKGLNSGFSGEFNYINTGLYFAMASHDLDWVSIPKSINGKFSYRSKLGKSGTLKTDAMLSHGYSRLNYSKQNIGYDFVGLTNNNAFIKTTYNTELGEKWLLKTGIAYNRNMDNMKLDTDNLGKYMNTMHMKFSLVNHSSERLTLKTGADANYMNYSFNFSMDDDTMDTYPSPGSVPGVIKLDVEDWILAGYTEGDIRLLKKVALRLGVRGEYSTYTGKYNLAPRSSLAVKVGENSQVSAAWGLFYQQGQQDYLKYTADLGFESARHILLNYQYQKDDRIFRTEVYDKRYNNLIRYTPGQYAEYENLDNSGHGYARGIDLFWKDSKSLKNTTYWISYSYVDSKRLYRDYPVTATPAFVSPHNLSVVYKYWWQRITTQFAMTYTYSSGRLYNDPNSTDFMTGRTPAIHDLSANLSYVRSIFGWMTVFHVSVSNLMGQEHIYGYRFTEDPDQPGQYVSSPIKNLIRRTIIIGAFISID